MTQNCLQPKNIQNLMCEPKNYLTCKFLWKLLENTGYKTVNRFLHNWTQKNHSNLYAIFKMKIGEMPGIISILIKIPCKEWISKISKIRCQKIASILYQTLTLKLPLKFHQPKSSITHLPDNPELLDLFLMVLISRGFQL